jgi:hypothetical protein
VSRRGRWRGRHAAATALGAAAVAIAGLATAGSATTRAATTRAATARAATARCQGYPRPGTTATGPTPADLRAEYSVLARPREAQDAIALRRLGSLPENGILVGGARYLGGAAYGGRAFLVPARHLLASALQPVACAPRSQRTLQRSLLPSLRSEYAHQALCLVIVYAMQSSPSCQPAPGTVAAFLYGPGSPGFGLAPDGVPSVTLRFRGHGPIRAAVHDNFWIVNDPSLLLAPCGLDWTTQSGTVLRTVASCTTDIT